MGTTTTVLYRLVGQDAGASRVFGRVGGSASAMDKAMRAAALGAVVAGAVLVKAADDAVKFNGAMLKIQTQAGGTAKDVKVLSAAVLKMGPSTQQGPDKLADSLYHLKSVGLDNAKAMIALKTSSDLAALGGSDLEATTNALAGAWRTGIRGATDFGTAAATVNAIIGAGNMRMDDFVEAIGTGILASAKTFGLSLSQVGSALALMTDEGIPAADAATRLRMSFSLLGAASPVANKTLKTIGLTSLQLAQAMRGPQGIIGAITLLKTHLDRSGLSASRQAQVLSHAFGGGRSSSAIMTLVNNLDVLKKKQEQVNSSLSKYAPAVAAQRKTAQAQLLMLESALETMSIRIGNVMLPPLRTFVTWINSTLIPDIGIVKTKFMGLIPIDAIKSDLRSLQGNVDDFMKTLFPAKAGPPKQTMSHPGVQLLGGTERVIANAPGSHPGVAVLPGGERVIKNAPGSHPGVAVLPGGERVITAAIPKAPAVKSQGTKLAEQLKSSITDGIGNIDWNKIGGLLGKALVVGISAGLNSLGDLGATIIKLMGSIDWTNVGKAVGGQAIGFALGFIGNLGAQLFSLSFWKKHWLDVIFGVLAIIPIGRIAGVLGKVFGHIPILKIFAPLLKGVEHLGGWVEKGLGKLLKPIGKFLGNLGVAFTLGFEEIFPKAAGAIGRLLGHITGPFTRFQARALGWGRSLISGFVRGAENGTIAVGRWVGRFFKSVIRWFKGIFGIHSPARTMLPIGGALVMGFIHGAINVALGIGRFLYRWIFQPVNNFFGGAPMWLFNAGKGLLMGLVNGAVSAFGFVDKLVLQPVKMMFGWLWDKAIRPVLANIVGGFLAMAGTVIHGAVAMLGWVPGVGGKLKTAAKAFDEFAASVNASLGGIQPKTVPVTVSFNGVPQGKITGHSFTSTTGFTYSKGGLLKGPGTGTSDSILAMSPHGLLRVSNDEFIINAHSTRKHRRLIEAINADDVKQYAKGGMVGFSRAATGDMSGAARIQTAAEVKSIASAYAKAFNASTAVRGLTWARTQVGMPYQWGGNGNPSWDCSGFQSAIESVMRGESPHRRWATGAFSGNTAPPGWVLNAKAPFRIGVTNAGVGHTAGTINGVNVEMSTVGGRVGGGARGADDPMFPSHYGLVGFDKGGVARGRGYMPKMTHLPERVLSPRQTSAFEHLVQHLGTGLGGTGGGHFTKLGASIPLGVAAGVKGAGPAATGAVGDVAKGIISTFSREMGIASPAKKMRPLGAYVINGLVQGLTGTTASVKSATRRIASALYVAFGTGHSALQAKVAADNRQLLKLAAHRDTVAAKLKVANSRLASLQKSWAAEQASVADSIMQSSSVVLDASSSPGGFLTATQVVANFVSQAAKAIRFAGYLRKAQAHGLNAAAVQQISAAGVEGGFATAQALASASTAQIQKLNSTQKSMASAADKVGAAVSDAMYGAGIQTAKGLVKGLRSQEKAIDAEMLRIALAMQKSIKTALGIHSPSTVGADIGERFPQGLGVGVRRGIRHAVSAVAAMGTAVVAAGGRLATDSLAMPTSARRPASGGGQAAALAQIADALANFDGTDVHVHFNDPALRNLIDVQVKPKIRASEQEQARQHRVGRRR